MSSEDSIPEWKSGENARDALSAARLNAPVHRINDLTRRVNRIPADTEPSPRIWEHWLGKVIATPAGKTAATPPLYWVERQQASKALKSEDTLTLETEEMPGAKKTVKATCKGGGHAAIGDEVHVFVEMRQTTVPAVHYYFIRTGNLELVLVVKTGGAAGDSTTSCTFVYKLKDIFGVDIPGATGLTPDRPRFTNTEYNQPADGSPGLAWVDAGGAWHLYEAVEEIPETDLVNIVSDVRWNSTSGELEQQVTPIRVLEKGTPAAYVPFGTYYDCT